MRAEDAIELRDLRAELARLREERDHYQADFHSEMEENARLREENENVKRWFREAEGHRDYWKNREQKRTAALEAERDRLREELENSRWETRRAMDERDRLLEGSSEIDKPFEVRQIETAPVMRGWWRRKKR